MLTCCIIVGNNQLKFYICALNFIYIINKIFLMRNRSAIWIFTILLFLVCLYQLSFSWVTKSFESDIHDLAETKYDSLSNEAVEFVINGDTLVIGPDKEKQQIVSSTNKNFLAEKSRSTYLPCNRFRLSKV